MTRRSSQTEVLNLDSHGKEMVGAVSSQVQVQGQGQVQGQVPGQVPHVAAVQPLQEERFQFKRVAGRRIQNPASTISYTATEIHGSSVFKTSLEELNAIGSGASSSTLAGAGPKAVQKWHLPAATEDQNLLLNNPNYVPPNQHQDSIVKTPWFGESCVYKPGSEGLSEEIVDFTNYIKTTPEEIYMRKKIIRKVRKVVKQVFPRSKLKVFGSFKTGLYFWGGDFWTRNFGIF